MIYIMHRIRHKTIKLGHIKVILFQVIIMLSALNIFPVVVVVVVVVVIIVVVVVIVVSACCV